MVPAQRGDEELFSQVGYLLSGDHERAERLVASSGSTVETLVRAWLDDPDEEYGRADAPAVAALPPRRRAVVVLRHWAGLPVAEVARIVSCPEEEADEPGEWWAEELRAVGAEPAGVRRRHRSRSVMIAVGVLVVAGVFTTVLGVGSPEPAPEAAVVTPRWTPPPGEELAPLPPGAGPVVVDAQARKLTAQLADAVEREFPELTGVRAGPSGPLTGNTERPPLEFFTRAETHPPGRYLAQAIVDAHGEGALVLLEVWREVVADTVPACPGHERDCVFQEFPDRTRAEVAGFVDPGSGGAVRRLTSSRPDGTVARVTAYGAPLSVAEMFRFALVFSW